MSRWLIRILPLDHKSMAKLGAQVVGADASYENIQMAKLHARKDPALWVGPGSLEYRNTTAGKSIFTLLHPSRDPSLVNFFCNKPKTIP